MYNKDAQKNRKVFMDSIDIHIEEYKNGKPIKTIAKENNVSNQFVSETFVSFGAKLLGRRKYTLDEHYFDIIDTQDKAYYLGLLFSDGCNNICRYAVRIGLQERDKEILEKFSYDIKTNRPLRFIKTSDSYIYGRLIKSENV